MASSKLRDYSDLVMFSHSLFALPFAYLGALIASGGIPSISDIVWITLAMVGARNGANALNRLVDKEIDARNPRTAGRHLPKGLVSEKETVLLVIACFALFLFAAWQLNPLAIRLLPIAAFVILLYSYTKRFTWLCHLVLGAACGMAPAGAWIAIRGTVEIPTIMLGAIVACWVGGFDIIYATQDIEFDKREGLKSIPARFGIQGALWISRLLHVGTIMFLLSLSLFFDFSWIYFAGVAAVALLLAYEHFLAARSIGNGQQIETAAYKVNQIIAPVVFLFALLDVILTGGL